MVLGTKTDIWRVDTIGEGEFKHSVREACVNHGDMSSSVTRAMVQTGSASVVKFDSTPKSRSEASRLVA